MQVVYLDFSKAALEVAKARAEVLNPTTKNKTMKKGIQITNNNLKGIVHNFFFYRSNLIFWIVMGCGIADLGRRGL